ncbi:MAG: GNAT family N-acetyltransferase [candidate division WOR-3 bacterium]|nr:MAG: GNAT family N-acetyltransferase [candidate division WOR-3 bacterium]
MEKSDIAYAKSLTDIEGWGHLEEDFERFLSLDPAGCYVAWYDGERAGIVTSVSYGDRAFLGNLIVRKDRRGMGIGVKLMEEAIGHLDRRRMKTIELDGVFKAVQTYRLLGFKDKYLSLRFARQASEGSFNKEPNSVECVQDIEEILSFDRQKTGIDRKDFLMDLLNGQADTTYISRQRDICGYVVTRERETGVLHIGPMVAGDASTASDLMTAICAKHGDRNLTIGVPCIHTAAVSVVMKHGFLHRPPSLRMFRGSRMEYERNVYAIVSADAG